MKALMLVMDDEMMTLKVVETTQTHLIYYP